MDERAVLCNYNMLSTAGKRVRWREYAYYKSRQKEKRGMRKTEAADNGRVDDKDVGG